MKRFDTILAINREIALSMCHQVFISQPVMMPNDTLGTSSKNAVSSLNHTV